MLVSFLFVSVQSSAEDTLSSSLVTAGDPLRASSPSLPHPALLSHASRGGPVSMAGASRGRAPLPASWDYRSEPSDGQSRGSGGGRRSPAQCRRRGASPYTQERHSPGCWRCTRIFMAPDTRELATKLRDRGECPDRGAWARRPRAPMGLARKRKMLLIFSNHLLKEKQVDSRKRKKVDRCG